MKFLLFRVSLLYFQLEIRVREFLRAYGIGNIAKSKVNLPPNSCFNHYIIKLTFIFKIMVPSNILIYFYYAEVNMVVYYNIFKRIIPFPKGQSNDF